jgi:hypothetical protein
MKFDAASIKSKTARRFYLMVAAPVVFFAFFVILAYELVKKIGSALVEFVSYDVIHNFGTIADSFHYCWIGKEEFKRRHK